MADKIDAGTRSRVQYFPVGMRDFPADVQPQQQAASGLRGWRGLIPGATHDISDERQQHVVRGS